MVERTSHTDGQSERCPSCKIRLRCDPNKSTQLICPKCGFKVNHVSQPTSASGHRTGKRTKTSQPKILLSGQARSASDRDQPPALKKRQQKVQIPKKHIPKHIAVVCSLCGTRIDATVKEQTRKVKCPDCYSPVPVPSLKDTLEELEKQEHRKSKPEDVKAFSLVVDDSNLAINQAIVLPNILDVQSEIRTELPPPPPRWTFFTGVFSFPWRINSIKYWLILSCSWLIVTWILLAQILPLVSGDVKRTWQGLGSFGNAIMSVCFLAGGTITLLWSSTYGAAVFLAVLVDTAAGNDDVTLWPEFNILEWFDDFFQIVYTAMLAVIPAAVAAQVAASFTQHYWPSFTIILFIVFPVFLLSSLETNSRWTPMTEPILKSLFVNWSRWMMFYSLSVGGALLLLLGDSFCHTRSPNMRSLLLGPAIAAATLIYARLLGRLTWQGATRHKNSKTRKKKRPERKKDAYRKQRQSP